MRTGWPVRGTASLSASGFSYTAAGTGLLLVAAVMTAWTVTGWVHSAPFNAAADRLFSTPAFADDDYAVATVEYSYAGVLLVASALTLVTITIGWAVLDRWRRARAATIILGVVLIAFSVKVFMLGFITGIQVPDTGISDRLFRQSVHQFNELTPWRMASWFHIFSLTAGVLTIVVVVASWWLLRNSAPKYHPAYT